MRALDNLHIRSKILIIVFVSFLGMGGIFAYSLYDVNQTTLRNHHDQVKEMIDVAYSLTSRYEAEVRAGRLPEQQAKQAVINDLRELRYGDNDYYFVVDTNLHMVMYPIKPELEGKDVSDVADTDGNHVFQEMVNIVKKDGAGIYSYNWKKPGGAQPVEKLTYVKVFAPWGWVIGTGLYMDDVAKEFRDDAVKFGSIVLIITLVVIALSLLIARIITRPLRRATESMETLAGGNANLDIADTDRRDEVGDIAKSLLVFKQNALEKLRLEEQQKQAEIAAKEEKKAMMNKLASDFESGVQGIITSVASASTELSQTAEGMQHTVANVSEQSGTAASASQQTSSNVQSVTAAVEEMSASIKEIASQVGKLSVLIGETVTRTQQADRTTRVLVEAVTQISGILELIQNIAGQINLLALNATIESARAGDAGKGFAVVASEVKNLASQTGKATEQIAIQITNVQQASGEVVEALKLIQSAIGEVSQYASGIASAVEEQSAATNDIASNMQQAAHGVENVTTNLSSINKGAAEADHASKEVLTASQLLSKQSELLNTEVSKFIAGLMADTADFDDAIKAHRGWKTKLSSYIAHPNNAINHDEVALDNHCMLGQWIHNNLKKYAQMPEFSTLRAEHANFHKVTGEIVRLVNSGQHVAEAVIGEGSEFAHVSLAVIDAMLKLKVKLAK